MKPQTTTPAGTVETANNSRLDNRFKIAVAICLTPWLWLATPASGAPVFVETFEGAALDPGLWSGGGVSVNQGRARMDILPNQPPGGTGFGSKFRLVGDFDVRVDYALDPWPYDNWLHFAFTVYSPDNSGESASVMVQRFSQWERESEIAIVPHDMIHPERSVANTTGTWRLTRSGDLFSAYTWDDGGAGQWILLGSASMTATLPLQVGAGYWSDRISSSQASIMFDNLTIETGTIVFVPEPSSVLLLGFSALVWFFRGKPNQVECSRTGGRANRCPAL